MLGRPPLYNWDGWLGSSEGWLGSSNGVAGVEQWVAGVDNGWLGSSKRGTRREPPGKSLRVVGRTERVSDFRQCSYARQSVVHCRSQIERLKEFRERLLDEWPRLKILPELAHSLGPAYVYALGARFVRSSLRSTPATQCLTALDPSHPTSHCARPQPPHASRRPTPANRPLRMHGHL